MQALSARGWVEGRSFKVEYRGAEGNFQRLSTVAAELAQLPADLIVAPGTSEAIAARKATSSIAVVFTAVDDPVDRGLVASLARPAGNVTGIASDRRELGGKLLSLLRDLLPAASRVALITVGNEPEHKTAARHLEVAARSLGLSLHTYQVNRHTEVEPAFAAIAEARNDLLIVPSSSMLVPRWIADLALAHRLPLASTSPDYAYEGGLIAYTDDWSDVFARAADYVDRILKGARPAELPVELPSKFRLIVNMQTSRTLGLTVPMSVIIRTDHLIE